jgi:hypothetical protein
MSATNAPPPPVPPRRKSDQQAAEDQLSKESLEAKITDPAKSDDKRP